MDKLPIPANVSVLIVEDDYFSRELLLNSFIGTQSIWAAPNGRTAWKIYEEKKPDIMFLDIGLPDGKGHDLAALIKDDNPNAYVVMITASNDIDDKMNAAHNRVNGYITKPVTRVQLKDCLDRYLAQRRKKIQRLV